MMKLFATLEFIYDDIEPPRSLKLNIKLTSHLSLILLIIF